MFSDTDKKINELLLHSDIIEKIYGYSYNCCYTHHEAEDLCQEILYSILKSAKKNPVINNMNAYIWTIAHRVYADFVKKKVQARIVRYEEDLNNTTDFSVSNRSQLVSILDEIIAKDQLVDIVNKISFLSKSYRDVMVMYYFDEIKIKDITKRLNISESNVKQRLFTGRKIVKKEVEKMNSKDLLLKPKNILWSGDGDPRKSYPISSANRLLSKNILYLCKDEPVSMKNVAKTLNMPMCFVEEEMELLCRGSRGDDGLIMEVEGKKYISTFIMLEYDVYNKIQSELKKYVKDMIVIVEEYCQENLKKIVSMFNPIYKINESKVLWSLILPFSWCIVDRIKEGVLDKRENLTLEEKDYYPFGIVYEVEEELKHTSYGCDAIYGHQICGYSDVELVNIYGKRKKEHFHCDANIAINEEMLLMLKTINGLNITNLSSDEQEIAAKAIKNKYIQKIDDTLYPDILVMDMAIKEEYYHIIEAFKAKVENLAERIAPSMEEAAKHYLPKHLYGQIDKFLEHSIGGFETELVEKCIEKGILNAPNNLVCSEGTYLFVKEQRS